VQPELKKGRDGMNLGYVGLGMMGGALARRLQLSQQLRVFDLRPDRVADLTERGAVAASGLADVARDSDVVLTCLPTSEDVRSAIFEPGGLLEGLRPGAILADMTTGDPKVTQEMAAELAPRGVTLVDAPVSGGPAGADAGTIAIMVGGPEKVFEELYAVFTSISPNVFHCGEQVGAGHTMKLVNNVIAAGVRAVTFEAVAMGIKSGLDLAKLSEVLDKGSAHSFTTQRTLPRLVAGEGTETFALRLMHKDVRLATQRGVDCGAPMPLAGVVREFLQASMNDDGEDKSVNWTLRMVERHAGVRIADVG
jgi:3-hydroxyisobutyrate dehydrogenase